MKLFNKLFVVNQTKVKVHLDKKWHIVEEIHSTRKWIKIKGLCGSWQRAHISNFSNRHVKIK